MELNVKAVLLILLSLSFGVFVMAQTGTDKEPWKKIFNGKDLKSWSVVGSEGKVWIEYSAIVVQKKMNTTQHTFVRTNEKYGDFIFECDVKTDTGFSSGILFRSVDMPDSAVCLFGYQVRLDPSVTRKWTGGVYDDFGNRRNWLYTLENDARAREAYKYGQWNHFRIETIGNNIKVWVNGIPTCNMINDKYTKGYIAFKIHSMKDEAKDEKTKGYFKNIRIITDSPQKYTKPMDIEAVKIN